MNSDLNKNTRLNLTNLQDVPKSGLKEISPLASVLNRRESVLNRGRERGENQAAAPH